MFSSPRWTSICLLALFLTSCSRQAATGVPRTAVLRFENLTPDIARDWMGRAASEIIARELATNVVSSSALHASPLAQFRPVSAPGESAEQSAAVAEGATRIVIGQISLVRGRLMLDVTERDPATGRNTDHFTLAESNANDLYSLADAAAHRLSPQVTPFDSRNNDAIGFWARALEAAQADYAAANSDFARAVQADPNFATAWLAWAGTASAHGDRAAIEKIMAQAQPHTSSFSPVNRARLKVVAAQSTGDHAAVLAAVNEIGRLLPNDADSMHLVAEENYASHQFAAAVAAYRQLTHIAPGDKAAWNQLGYALLFAGDYQGAMAALRTYQELAPADANPLDSQGDVAFAFGRFAEAVKLYEQAAAKAPAPDNSAELYKAAEAHLMTGDVAGADAKFGAYVASRKDIQDALLPLRMTQWRFFSGRHEQAWSELTTLLAASNSSFKMPQLRAVALTQLAVWDLQLGRRSRALQESSDALKTGAATPDTLIARFACEEAHTAAEWSALADQKLGSPQLAQLKPVALAYALYLSHRWADAEPLWKQLVARSGVEDVVTPAIYAQILVELNRPRDVAAWQQIFPLPPHDGVPEFLSLVIPQIFATRAAIQAAEGKTAEAEASRKLFKTLWGVAR